MIFKINEIIHRKKMKIFTSEKIYKKNKANHKNSVLAGLVKSRQNIKVIKFMILQRNPIKLPDVIPYDPYAPDESGQRMRRQAYPGQVNAPELSELLDKTVSYLCKQFHMWKIDEDFEFQLPESQFDHKRDRPLITYLQAERIQDEGMVAPLTAEQLEGIRTEGTFTVNSRRYAIPYKWQISKFLQLGSVNRQKNLYVCLGSAFSFLYSIKEILDLSDMRQYAVDVVKHIAMLYIGINASTIVDKRYEIQRELEKERQKNAYDKYWTVCERALFEYFQFPINLTGKDHDNHAKLISERQQKVNKLSSDLNLRWIAEREKIVDEYEEKYPSDQLKDQIKKYQRGVFLKVLQQNTELDDALKTHILHLYDDIRTFNALSLQMSTRVGQANTEASNQIRRDFPIRSQCYNWFLKINQKAQAVVQERERQWMIDQLKRRINVPYFQDYLSNCDNYTQSYKTVEERLGKTIVPEHTFYQSYPLFAPYQVNYNPETNIYFIKTRVQMPVATDKNFWKFQLMWVRLITWSRSSFYHLVRTIWTSNLGVRVLFERRKFYPEYILNSTTGQLGRSRYHQRTPLYVSVVKNLRKIQYLRNQFDNAPDSGLFNKRVARFFHLFTCYFLILFCQTILGLLIIKPILIILNLVACSLLILTIPVWVPAAILLIYGFQIHIYNFEAFHCQLTSKYYYNYYDPPRAFMLLRLVLILAGQLILLILRVTIAPLFMLVMAGLVAGFGYLMHFTRTVYDAVMFLLIKAVARSPVTDSAMAWKIAGPGISSTYYQSVKSTDIYVLVLAQIQKMHLEVERQQISQALQRPQTQANKVIHQFQRQLASTFYLNLPKLQKSISFYNNKLQQQIGQRFQHYPSSPGTNVRFTEEQMLSYTKITKQILSKYLQKNPHLNFYKYLGIRKQNMDKIVKKIWERIFQGNQVFSILQQRDMRMDVMKESEEKEEVHRLADLIARENAEDDSLQGLSGVNFQALAFEDDLINMTPEDMGVTSVTWQVCRCNKDQLPSSKQDITLSVVLNANIPVL